MLLFFKICITFALCFFASVLAVYILYVFIAFVRKKEFSYSLDLLSFLKRFLKTLSSSRYLFVLFCVLWTILFFVCFGSVTVSADYEEVLEDDVTNIITDDSLFESPVESPAPVSDPVPAYPDLDVFADSINGLSETLLTQQNNSFDNLSLLSSADVFGFEIVEQSSDFALLYFSRTNTFVLVSHNAIVNLGSF